MWLPILAGKLIEIAINKGNCMLGYLKQNLHFAPTTVKLLFYKTIVHSQLENRLLIWDPGIDILTNQLKMIVQDMICFEKVDCTLNHSVL